MTHLRSSIRFGLFAHKERSFGGRGGWLRIIDRTMGRGTNRGTVGMFCQTSGVGHTQRCGPTHECRMSQGRRGGDSRRVRRIAHEQQVLRPSAKWACLYARLLSTSSPARLAFRHLPRSHPGVLGFVHGGVGSVKEAIGGVGVFRIESDADAGRASKLITFALERLIKTG